MKKQWLGFGKDVDLFEKNFMQKFDVPNFIMVDSGSNALFMAVILLNLPSQSEIILPSFTWVSCAHAIMLAGHKPVFCDVALDTMNVRIEDIKEKLTNKTSAVMVVHYGGLAVDLDPILELGLPVIEDAAHAVCSTYKNKHCGTIGDIGIFSFDAIKNLTTGEGGGISIKNLDLLKRARTLRYCGIGKSGFDTATETDNKRWWEHNVKEPFIKMLPTNIAANIGRAQLQRIDQLQARRREIWGTYKQGLSKLSFIRLPKDAVGQDEHSYFTYCVRVPERDALANYLLTKDVYTTLRYYPLHMNDLYAQTNVVLKNTLQLNEEGLNLPLHPRLSNADIYRVIDLIRAFYGY